MAKSGALNPASVPFFPGVARAGEEDNTPGLGYAPTLSAPLWTQDHQRQQQQHQQHQQKPSSPPPAVSTSPSDRRARVSPSSLSQLDSREDHSAHAPINTRFQQSPPSSDSWMRQSPLARSVESDKPFMSHADTRLTPSISNTNHSPPLDDFHAIDGLPLNSSASFPFRQGTAPTSAVGIQNGRFPSGSANSLVLASSSPVSSLGSSSQFASNLDYSTSGSLLPDAQLRTSPFIQDILDRITRCETVHRDIQRELSDVHRKVDLLVERALGAVNEEFKDPFAPPGSGNSLSISPMMVGGMPGSARPSISGVGGLPAGADDITQISQRLNTLTTSVGQLLALQTQQHINGLGGMSNAALNGHITSVGATPHDIAPNQMGPPPLGPLGHSLPNRPDLRPSRTPNPPLRTWSQGSLDLPMRPVDVGGLNGRGPDGMLRDKRRSVSNNLMRRESMGDVMGGRDPGSGLLVAKWEQLNLAPELLRSLTKFGVGPPNKIQQRALPFLLRGSDIIAQAPPTQERIAAYVIPAIHVALIHSPGRQPLLGPLVVMVSTTVDQATQAQRMIRDLGGPIGVRSALGVGVPSAGTDLSQELRLLQQNMPHIICGTPQKLHALFTAPGGLLGSHVRFLVLDEVDQLIARNLHDFIFNIVKLLPPPRSRPVSGGGGVAVPSAPGSSFEGGAPLSVSARRFSASPIPPDVAPGASMTIERQTALFSNTVPQDVLNLATTIQLREPIRVLVRRDGNVTHADAGQSSRGLRQFYLYLALTAGGGRSDSGLGTGLGIIGSGRGAGGSSAETAQAREWKLDALSDLFDDIDVSQAIVHVGGMTALDSVVYKLASRGLDAIPLHGDMNQGTKLAALNKFRSTASHILRSPATRVLVVYDVQVKNPEVSHIPLIINYDLPKAVEEYAHRVAPAIAPNTARAGVVINFVTATGGDVEMLRSIECFYKIKCPEVPISLRDIV